MVLFDLASARRGAAALVCAVALGAAAPCQDPGEAPAVWDRYQVFLWTFGDRALDPALLTTLRSLHVTGLNREGTAPAAALRAAGLGFYVGDAAGKGILHLREPDFQPHWDRYWKDRDPRHLERPHCPRDPAVMRRLLEHVDRVLAAQTPHRPVACSFGDEISITRRLIPLDFCFCPYCLAAFRSWLRERYRTLEVLNRQWRTDFEAWDAVVPFTADRIKQRERRMAPAAYALGPWADHRAFMDETLAWTLEALRARARERGVAAPVGFLGGQAPSAYGGYDWGRLLAAVDWVEAYDQGGAMEVVRGLGPDVIRVRTYFPAGRGEGANRHRLWKYFAHGDRGAILWSDREVLDADGRPTAYALGLESALAALTSAAARRIVALPVADDGVALYYSQASIRAGWMADSRRDGPTWMKRFGSYEVAHATQMRRRRAWHRLLEDAGVQYRYVDARAVAAGRGLDGVRLLVLAGVSTIDPAEEAALRAYLERGGRILADRVGAALGALLAHRRAAILEAPVLRYLTELERGGHLPAAVAEVTAHLERAGIEAPCRARATGASAGCFEVLRRPAPDGDYYFVLRNRLPEEEERLDAEAWEREDPVRVEFPAPVRAREVFGAGRWEGRTLEHRVRADRPWVFFVERE
ncbi:MAG: beta-galactosidase [Planctomycetes bacterium]|nr:beta-galactosidase [Planctomycetota bacterium]